MDKDHLAAPCGERVATIPPGEEAALRAAFEASMRNVFSVNNLKRTTDEGYIVPEVQMAWFCARCGWLSGNRAAPSPTKEPKE